MLFTTFTFTCFFLIVAFIWWGLLPNKALPRQIFMILASFIFYAWADLRWTANLLLICSLTWFFSKHIMSLQNKKSAHIKKAGILYSSILLLPLVLWKYVPWAVMSWNEIPSLSESLFITPPEWLYPVGLSFFTFHALSLFLSVWLEKEKPLNAIETFAHISFFPSLLAGPVLRRKDITPRWYQSWKWEEVEWVNAIYRIMLGMTFKWVFAAKAAEWADPAFQNMTDTSIETWLGVHAYSLQIFFDFAGYSHIALGVALLLGFKLPENFSQPYLSLSIQDFWRNWHRSLSFFFRDYVYIHMLGGSKGKKRYQTLFNGFLTMFISGIWHGANITFVLWGIWHGLFLMINFMFRLFVPVKLPKIVGWLLTFEVVTWGWVWFRATDFDNAIDVFKNSWAFVADWHSVRGINIDQHTLLWVIGMALFIGFEKQILDKIYRINEKQLFFIPAVGTALFFSVWTWLIMYFGPVGVPAFIYNSF